MKKDQEEQEPIESEEAPAGEEAETVDEVDGEAPTPEDPAGEAPETDEAERSEEEEALEHQLLRLRADFENYRKRITREKADWNRQAIENLVNDLLPVLDHYEMGLSNAREHDAKPAVLEGFEMVEQQLKGALRKYQLEVIDAAEGEFDPALHEAINFLPSPDVPANQVVAQVRCGYRLGERLLRPAQVVVSSGQPETTDTKDEADVE